MVEFTFRPLRWDRPSTPATKRRSRSTFTASWSDTLNLLDRELDKLDAEHVVIEADFKDVDIRADGMPRANAKPGSNPGVRIAFDSKHGPLIYATDTHTFWQHNVRAIALSLQALRAVDRYGVTRRAEQYQGWKAIGTGQPNPAGPSTPDQAQEFIAAHGGSYTAAARRLHPDAGGTVELFQQLQQAKQILDNNTEGDQR